MAGTWSGAVARHLLMTILMLAGAARAADLVVIVDASTEMPWAEPRRDRVLRGLSRDLGEALAGRLGRQARMLVLPRKRIASALATGEADLACAYQPAWLPGPFSWSQAFLPDSELLLSRLDAPRPQGLAALRGQVIGTVRGFVYPVLEQALGSDFLREDAPDASSNLRKLAAGRVQHASVTRLFLDWQQRGQPGLPLHPPLELQSYRSHCALSPRSAVGIAALNKAIDGLLADGELNRLLQRYR